MARQYFNSQTADSLIVSGTTGSITAETAFLTAAQCEQAFPMPIGAGNQPFAGQIYRFTAGGIMTTGTAGTLVITPRYGTTTGGTSMGASAAQNYVPSRGIKVCNVCRPSGGSIRKFRREVVPPKT